MKRLLLLLSLLVASQAAAQTYPYPADVFGGDTRVLCAPPPCYMTITGGSQSGTTQTVVVSSVCSGPTPSATGGETFYITGTGTAMDSVPIKTTLLAGSSILTNIASTTLTLTSPISNTVGSISTGHIYPATAYISSTTDLSGRTGPRICTPQMNYIWFLAMRADTINNYNSTIYASKYGSNACTEAAAVISEMTAFGFIALGEETGNFRVVPHPSNNCNNFLPSTELHQVWLYGSSNRQSYAPQPVKNLIWGMNSNNKCTNHKAAPDVYDPNWQTWMNGWTNIAVNPSFGDSTVYPDYMRSPWFFFSQTDDLDAWDGPGGGPDFHTTSGSDPGNPKNDCDGAYLVSVTSPLQTMNNTPVYSGSSTSGSSAGYVYFDPLVYSKVLSSSAPGSCTDAAPCSLPDFLRNKYTTVGALNTAWSSSYSNFGSDGVGHGYSYSFLSSTGAAESFGAGNGVLTSFSHTFSDLAVTPNTVQILLNGVIIGGDCPGSNVLRNNYILGTATCVQGSTSTTGELTGPIEIWRATSTYPVNDVITDSNGNIQQVQSIAGTGTTGGSAPTWSTTVGGTTVDHAGANQLTWVMLGTGITTASSSITYSTGTATIVTNHALANGATLTVNYIKGGWGIGSGFMDEDGRHTTWMGSSSGTPICMLNNATSSPPVCGIGGDFAASNSNQTAAADIDGWYEQYFAKYFAMMGTAIHSMNAHKIYVGTQCGAWYTPCRKEYLKAIQSLGKSPMIFFQNWAPNFPNNTDGAAMYQTFLTQYYTGAVYHESFLTSPQSNWPIPGTCGQVPNQATQNARGVQWYLQMNKELTLPSFNSTYQWAGMGFWSWIDFQGCNWGIKTQKDNLYDGVEDVVASVSCSAPLGSLTCGGESSASWNSSDLFHCTGCVLDANVLWYASSAPPPAVVAPAVNILAYLKKIDDPLDYHGKPSPYLWEVACNGTSVGKK